MIITQISSPTGRLTLASSMRPMRLEQIRERLPGSDADDDADEHPDREVALEHAHRRARAACSTATSHWTDIIHSTAAPIRSISALSLRPIAWRVRRAEARETPRCAAAGRRRPARMPRRSPRRCPLHARGRRRPSGCAAPARGTPGSVSPAALEHTVIDDVRAPRAGRPTTCCDSRRSGFLRAAAARARAGWTVPVGWLPALIARQPAGAR